MKMHTCLAAAVTAALITLTTMAAPASAAETTATQNDATGDTWFSDDAAADFAAGLDIETVTYTKTHRSLRVTIDLADLNEVTANPYAALYTVTLKVAGTPKYVLTRWADTNHAFVYNLHTDTPVRCDRARVTTRPATDRVIYRAPARCLDTPRRLTARATAVLIDGSHTKRARDASTYGTPISLRP